MDNKNLEIFLEEIEKKWEGQEIPKPDILVVIGNGRFFITSDDSSPIVCMVNTNGLSFAICKKYLSVRVLSNDIGKIYVINSSDKVYQTGCRGPLNFCDKITYKIYEDIIG